MDPAGPERRQARAEREERARTTRSYVPGAVEGLSLLLPGLGHVYTRAAGQGLAWFALSLLALAGACAVFTRVGFGAGTVLVGAGLLVPRAGAMVHARRLLSRRIEAQPWRWTWIGAGVFGAVASTIVVSLIRGYWLDVRTCWRGMTPTVIDGDWVVVDRAAYGVDPPQPGDVAWLEVPNYDDAWRFVRVVAGPGARIRTDAGVLFVDDEPVRRCRLDDQGLIEPGLDGGPRALWLERLGARMYLVFDRPSPAMSIASATLARDEFFVLADQRIEGDDSRTWTPGREKAVRRKHFAGRAYRVMTSVEPGRAGFDPNGEPVLPDSLAELAPELARCRAELEAP